MLRLKHFKESVAKKVRVLTVVEPEAHLVKVGLQMLCANTMPRTHNPALEQRESGFYAFLSPRPSQYSLNYIR